ncbi:hypothetical protein MA9V1_021 [Chryseobacterium phage MA9V-1]|nr:hypothetical protein MA9V1_021 [Chryseobacterium phage MA9V-1]
MKELEFTKTSPELAELIAGLNTKGINYIAENFKLLGIEPSEDSIYYNFEHGLTLRTTGGSLSGESVVTTQLLNGMGDILATW